MTHGKCGNKAGRWAEEILLMLEMYTLRTRPTQFAENLIAYASGIMAERRPNLQ